MKSSEGVYGDSLWLLVAVNSMFIAQLPTLVSTNCIQCCDCGQEGTLLDFKPNLGWDEIGKCPRCGSRMWGNKSQFSKDTLEGLEKLKNRVSVQEGG